MTRNLFPELGQLTVNIGIGNDKYVEVKRLGMDDYDKFDALRKSMAEDAPAMEAASIPEKVAAQERLKTDLLAIVLKYLPEPLHANLRKMEVQQLIELARVLAHGDDDPIQDDPQKKMTY